MSRSHRSRRGGDIVLFVFPGTQQTLEAEGLLASKGLRPVLTPLPLEIGQGCGTAIRLPAAKEQAARALLAREGNGSFSVWQQKEKGQGWQKLPN